MSTNEHTTRSHWCGFVIPVLVLFPLYYLGVLLLVWLYEFSSFFYFFFYGGEAVLNVHFSREILERLPLVCLKIHQTGGGRVERHFFDFDFFFLFVQVYLRDRPSLSKICLYLAVDESEKCLWALFPRIKSQGQGRKSWRREGGG